MGGGREPSYHPSVPASWAAQRIRVTLFVVRGSIKLRADVVNSYEEREPTDEGSEDLGRLMELGWRVEKGEGSYVRRIFSPKS